ncbi:unnamed protein product, partial [Polarella glacialis]
MLAISIQQDPTDDPESPGPSSPMPASLDAFLVGYTPLFWVLAGIDVLHIGGSASQVLVGAEGLLTRSAVRQVVLEASAGAEAIAYLTATHGFSCTPGTAPWSSDSTVCSLPRGRGNSGGADSEDAGDVGSAWQKASNAVAVFRDGAQDNVELAGALKAIAPLFQAARKLDAANQKQIVKMVRSLSVGVVLSDQRAASGLAPRWTLEAMLSAWSLSLPACLA